MKYLWCMNCGDELPLPPQEQKYCQRCIKRRVNCVKCEQPYFCSPEYPRTCSACGHARPKAPSKPYPPRGEDRKYERGCKATFDGSVPDVGGINIVGPLIMMHAKWRTAGEKRKIVQEFRIALRTITNTADTTFVCGLCHQIQQMFRKHPDIIKKDLGAGTYPVCTNCVPLK